MLLILIVFLALMVYVEFSNHELADQIIVTIITINVLLLGTNYVNVKELINIDVELINRIWITIPAGMSFFVYIENLLIEKEVILHFIITISILTGILLFFRIFRFLSNIQQPDSRKFWKFIHLGIFVNFCSSIITYFYSFESLNYLIGMQIMLISFIVINVFLVFSLKIALKSEEREVKKDG